MFHSCDASPVIWLVSPENECEQNRLSWTNNYATNKHPRVRGCLAGRPDTMLISPLLVLLAQSIGAVARSHHEDALHALRIVRKGLATFDK